MIWIQNRKICPDSPEEMHLGFVGDNHAKYVVFALPETGFADYSFQLNAEKETGEKGIIYLEKCVQGDRLLLSWEVESAHLAAGVLRAQICAFSTVGDEVWHSEQCTFYVGESIEAGEEFSEEYPSEPVEIETSVAVFDAPMTQETAEMSEICSLEENQASGDEEETETVQMETLDPQTAGQDVFTESLNVAEVPEAVAGDPEDADAIEDAVEIDANTPMEVPSLSEDSDVLPEGENDA